MKCSDVRTFFSQIAGKSVTMQVQQADMDLLSSSGYLSVMQKEEYDRALAECSNLAHLYDEVHNEIMEVGGTETALEEEERKTHSILFLFEGKEKRDAELNNVQNQRSIVSKGEADIAEGNSKISELVQKKSMIDRMVQYDGKYLALTGLGVIALNDLNVRNYRVSDSEFSDFIEESKETSGELRSIAEAGNFYMTNIRNGFPEIDLSQLWSVSIGLAKLQGDQDHIIQRFLIALDNLHDFNSTIENKMMAAEIMTASRADPSQSATNSDLQSLSETLSTLDRELKHGANVPSQLSAGVAAIIMAGRKFDGTYPTDRFIEFSKMTSSYESAAILSILNVPIRPTCRQIPIIQIDVQFLGIWGVRGHRTRLCLSIDFRFWAR